MSIVRTGSVICTWTQGARFALLIDLLLPGTARDLTLPGLAVIQLLLIVIHTLRLFFGSLFVVEIDLAVEVRFLILKTLHCHCIKDNTNLIVKLPFHGENNINIFKFNQFVLNLYVFKNRPIVYV